MELRVERVTAHDEGATAYLERDLVRNALDVWNLKNGIARYTLHACKDGGRIIAHLGLYKGEDAEYASLGGSEEAVKNLLDLVPSKAVITVPPALGEVVVSRTKPDKVYPNDIMAVERGSERLGDIQHVRRLTVRDAARYSEFGSSFNVPKVNLRRIRESLKERVVFGAFSDDSLVSIASLVAWLPRVSVVMGVETKDRFRRRGFGTSVVSDSIKEGMARSGSCTLFVRSDNHEAIRLYRRLGFRKIGDELWIDRGTGIVP